MKNIFLVLCLCGLLASAVEPTREIKTASSAELVLIPAGTFAMGSNTGADDARPAHNISVSSFWTDHHVITQESYEDLMGVNPVKFEGDKNPVEMVR